MLVDTLIERLSKLDNNPREYTEQLLKSIDVNAPIETTEHAINMLLIGRGYLVMGRNDLSIHILNKTLEYLIEHGDDISVFQCYSNLGIAYREDKQYTLALKILTKSYDLSYDLDDFSFVIQALVNLSSVYALLKNVQKSMELLDKALEFKDRLENSKILGDLYNNYAFSLLHQKNFTEALSYFFQAYQVYKRLYGDTIQTNMLIVLSNIGETFVELKDYDNAKIYINKALLYAEKNNIKVVEIDCHLNLSKAYEALDDYKTALFHQKKYAQLNEEVLSKNSDEEIDSLKHRFEEETKKSEAEINTLRNVELKSKTTELEKTLRNLGHISQIGRQLTSSMDIDQIYDILRSSIYALMKVDVFGLALYEQNEGIILYKYFEEQGRSLPLMEINVKDESSLASYCINNDEDMFVKSFYEEYKHYLPGLSYLSMGNDKEDSTKCIIYCRLISEHQCIGLITMQSYQPYEYSEFDFEVIKALASYVAIAISNAQKKNIISEKAKELEYFSYKDPLTGLFNRRYFSELTDTFNSDENILPLGLIIVDMNALKDINDTQGHLIGDQYLVEVARILKKNAGDNPVFRLGGDEFAIFLIKATDSILIDTINKIYDDCKLSNIGLKPLSLSLGYDIKKTVKYSIEELFTLAESKMYSEKNKYYETIK